MRLAAVFLLLGAIQLAADDAWTSFTQELEDGFAAGESWKFTAALQRDRLLASARSGLPDSPEISGAMTGLRERFEIGRHLCADIAGGRGSARFVHSSDAADGAERIAVLRWLGATGLEYLSLRLVREPAGEIAIADVYFHRAGQSLAEALRHSILGLLPADTGDTKLQLTEAEQRARERVRELGEVRRRYAQGDYAGAMVLHSGLPRVLREDRALLLDRVRCGLNGDPGDLSEALGAYRKAHPTDVAADLLLVAHRLAAGNIAPDALPESNARVGETLAAIDRIELVAGRDPYLELLRGEAELLRGAIVPARAHARRAAEAEPGLEPAHWAVLTLALRAGDHAEVARALSILAERFAAQVDSLVRTPAFSGFSSSPIGQTWRASRPKK